MNQTYKDTIYILNHLQVKYTVNEYHVQIRKYCILDNRLNGVWSPRLIRSCVQDDYLNLLQMIRSYISGDFYSA